MKRHAFLKMAACTTVSADGGAFQEVLFSCSVERYYFLEKLRGNDRANKFLVQSCRVEDADISQARE